MVAVSLLGIPMVVLGVDPRVGLLVVAVAFSVLLSRSVRTLPRARTAASVRV